MTPPHPGWNPDLPKVRSKVRNSSPAPPTQQVSTCLSLLFCSFWLWLLLFFMPLTLAPSKQVNSSEKLQLQECLWSGKWGLEEAGAGSLQ